MDWGTIASVGLGLLGNYQARSAAQDAAASQQRIAEQAAAMSEFKPYTVTTGFGTGFFDEEAQQAGYVLDPALQAYRDALMGIGAQALPETVDVGQASQQYYDQMKAMQAPAQAQEDIAMRNRMFGTGRLGMRLAGEAAGAGEGTGMYQPDVLGVNKARALADQTLAMQARQQAQNELDAAIARGTGLFQQSFGVEQLGMSPLTMGAEFGGRGSTAGANAASMLMQGGLGAAQANLAAGLNTSNTLSGLGLGLLKYNS
jgi:hypothetical protein